MTYHEELKLRVMLLELQVESLRSVLSEFNEGSLNQYNQMIRADAIEQLLNNLKRPEL